MISEGNREGDTYQFRFTPDIARYMRERLLIAQSSPVRTITRAQLVFYDDDDKVVCDDEDNPRRYTSISHDLGHILDNMDQDFPFSYAKCLLDLVPGSSFDLHDLYFHFAERESTTRTTRTGNITGLNSFSIDSIGRIYNVSTTCPSMDTCMWYLDNDVINSTSSTTVVLIFKPEHVGNRTLSYARIISNNPIILASLLLYILPNTIQVCNNLPKNPKNKWLPAGNMSSPRAYFTATYLQVNQFILIAGGTADGSTVLSSVDIYDPDTGCCNNLNMTIPRMKHTASYFNSSDIVLVIGGVGSTGAAIQLSELISINASNSYRPMAAPRYSHAIATINNSNILIVAGIGFNVTTDEIEMYASSSAVFQVVALTYNELINLEGHSVTSLGTSGSALIFGGHNGVVYPEIALLSDGISIENATNDSLSTILGRAYHNAIYLPDKNAVLITGGQNGTHVFQSCYLYYVATNTFNATGSMSINRAYHASVRLSNGSVLIIGGAVAVTNGVPNTITAVVERYDPGTGTFTTVASLQSPRYGHVAVLHNNYEVFVFGGFTDNAILQTIEFLMVDSWS